jgi:ADP-heptose:LPS heptosyltransferase
MIRFISRAYRRIGIHTAPPGTLFFLVDGLVRRVLQRSIFGYASGNPFSRSKFGGTPYYNITNVRRNRPVNGLALVYFMGAGDYLMTTPLIAALHLAYPDLPIYAFASTHADTINSPLVVQLLRTNPMIDRVFTYNGKPRPIWDDYDFSDALKDIPPGFVILPVIYEVEPTVFHRATSLLETFGLPVDLPVPAPIVYPAEMSAVAQEIWQRILDRIEQTSPETVVCLHFGARSSGYEYPHAARLAAQLVRMGYLVVSFSPAGVVDANVIEVDVTKVSLTDSIEILRELKSRQHRLFMISVNSLMWPISAAFDIPNLGLHTFWDPAIHQYLYPNIYVVTQHLYDRLPPCRSFLAGPQTYEERKPNRDTTFADYNPEFAVDCFTTMVASLKR